MFNKTPKLETHYEALQREVVHKLIIGINYAMFCVKRKRNQLVYFRRPPICFIFQVFELIN